MKKIITIILCMTFISLVIISQLWNYNSYDPYFTKDYNGITFIYDKDNEPIGVSYQNDIESIFFLKERNSKVYTNDYNKKEHQYQWNYEEYTCEIEIMKNTSIFRYGEKSIYIFIKSNDFWIRRHINCSNINNDLDLKNIKNVQKLVNPYISQMINIYEKYHQQIKQTYQKGSQELQKEKATLFISYDFIKFIYT